MLGTQALVNRLGILLGADTVSLAEPTTFVKVHLAKEAFTPSLALDVADLTEADFTGYAAKAASDAATQVFFDPETSEQIMQVKEPAGGWHWVTGGGFVGPQTIYGYYLTDTAGTTLWASELLETPVVLNTAGQGVDVDQVRVTLPITPLT